MFNFNFAKYRKTPGQIELSNLRDTMCNSVFFQLFRANFNTIIGLRNRFYRIIFRLFLALKYRDCLPEYHLKIDFKQLNKRKIILKKRFLRPIIVLKLARNSWKKYTVAHSIPDITSRKTVKSSIHPGYYMRGLPVWIRHFFL